MATFGKYIYLVRATGPMERYDVYDSFVGCADSEDEIRQIHPEEGWSEKEPWSIYKGKNSKCWVQFLEIDTLVVTKIGEAANNVEKGVLLASFNAG